MRSFAGRFMSEAQSLSQDHIYSGCTSEFRISDGFMLLLIPKIIQSTMATACLYKKSATIKAFSHFVLQETACQYMFSDIQGTHMTSSKGRTLPLSSLTQ
ncbi:hypothetical protein HGRIS_001234 [Hohenbuehelia grisea]|uniref:Alpha-type protein kinase domain-containing protein n=1 Tax=Hohenbuehelia grisea TaxID=104357 RepID=A0ABR3JQ23_9AGAR